jgi:pyruvate carboxylase
MFGDIVKVTPTSKVVGDMALSMIAAGLTRADVESPDKEVAFPDSVVQLMRGDLGQPPGGWPPALQAKVLKGQTPSTVRPGAIMPPADLDALRAEVAQKTGRPPAEIGDTDLASYIMYSKVFLDFAKTQDLYGPTEILPTPVYFYGLKPGEETQFALEAGKTLMLVAQAVGETDEEGQVKVFFELNGQPRIVKVPNRAAASTIKTRRKAEDGNAGHIAAPMPGIVSSVAVKSGQAIKAGDVLLSIEAMKMETVLHADRDGVVSEVLVNPGAAIDAKDLLVVVA